MKTFALNTTENRQIIATEFAPEKPNGKVLLINAATGIPQRFYYNFAEFWAEKGYYAYTYDYSGIGLSKPHKLKDFDADYKTWGQIDYPAIANFIKENHPERRMFLVGHSFGGNCLGLSPVTNYFERIALVASQHGYWRYFHLSKQPLILFTFSFLMPFLTRTKGFFPSNIIGLGEDLPKGAALDWSKIMLNRNSFRTLLREDENFYSQIDKPMLLISIDDDWQAPTRAVEKLAEEYYKNAAITRRHIFPKEIGEKSIGHINFFRRKFRETLWKEVFDWIEND